MSCPLSSDTTSNPTRDTTSDPLRPPVYPLCAVPSRPAPIAERVVEAQPVETQKDGLHGADLGGHSAPVAGEEVRQGLAKVISLAGFVAQRQQGGGAGDYRGGYPEAIPGGEGAAGGSKGSVAGEA